MHLHPQSDAVAVIDPAGDLHIFGESTGRYGFASVTKILTAQVIAHVLHSNFSTELTTSDTIGAITYADLLSHASGMRPGTLEPIAPRTKRIYTNEAYETAERLLREQLSNTDADFSIANSFDETLGAHLESTIIIEGSCASGATGTFDDLVRVLQEIRTPTFLDAATHSQMTQIYLPDLDGIVPGWGHFEKNTWGIGYEIRGNKSHWMGAHSSPQTFGHFGQQGAFVMHDPHNHISIATISNESFGPWAKELWPIMCDEIYAQYLK